MHAAQHRVLVRRQVDHAIGYDHVEAARIEAEFVEPLDIAMQEAHVVIAEGIAVELVVPLRHRKLLFGHVDADHFARRADQLRQCIHIAPRAAAQVEYATAFQQRRTDQAAAIIARQHFRVDARQQRLQPFRHLADVAAGAGFEVARMLQRLAVILLNDVMHDVPC